MLKINIITQLLVFFILAVSINYMTLNALFGLFIVISVALSFTKNNKFLRATLRFKWFFLVMLLIFAFNTPGEHVQHWPFNISPSYEGIRAGFTQIFRIMLMLAALSLILACNTRQNMISGLYFIFSPLKFFGQYFELKIERFAVRLWLTLHYVELQSETKHSQDFMSQLKNMVALRADQTSEDVSVTLTVSKLNFADYTVLAISATGALIYAFMALA